MKIEQQIYSIIIIAAAMAVAGWICIESDD